MAKAVDYKITLYPAGYDRGFLTSSFTILEKYPEREITAAGMPDLKNQIKAFADEHGEPCTASVRCLAPRKPPGFKKETSDLYYNMENVAPPELVKRLNVATAA